MYELQVLVVAAARQLPRLHGLAHAGAGLLAVQAAGAVARLQASTLLPGVLSGARVQVCV